MAPTTLRMIGRNHAMNHGLSPALVAGTMLLVAVASSPSWAATTSSLTVFGDSNVDIGWAAAELASGQLDDGVVPSPNTVGGRNSDGTIMPKFISQRLGVEQLNFAYSGATAGETNIAGLFGASDLAFTGTLGQIGEFETRLAGGVADAGSLYLVFAGSNDLFFADNSDQSAVDAAVSSADANLREAVTRLTGLGAEDIVVASRSPRPVLSDAESVSAEADPLARNDAAGRQLNVAIEALVADLDASLSSNVMSFDVCDVARDLIDGSGSNGFTAYSSADSQFCANSDDCSALINYGAAHKTSAVHSVLADRFID